MVRTQSPSARAVSGKPLLLIVDDDPLISDTLGYAFAKEFDVVTSHARPHCLALLRQLRHAPQVAVVDLGLPPQPHRPDEGFALIRDLLAHDPDMKIIVLSGQNGEDNARHARTLGAIDFVGKPCDPGRLLALLHQALAFTGRAAEPQTTAGLIGNSLPMQRLRLQLAQYAELAFPVLIEGESGSGKDIVASHCLHQETSRRQQPFLAVNCAAIPEQLLESELFGHERGAFTGATLQRLGKFELCNHGTLFLDEIGDMTPATQTKILRVLQSGTFERVGGNQPLTVDVRIIAATNRDLSEMVGARQFREDLFFR
ncbi:MAG: sigma-54-dependent transcriptional regulator, partial [Betaproteobacteria bacterium]